MLHTIKPIRRLALAVLALCSTALLVQSSPASRYFGDAKGSQGDFVARYAAGQLLKIGADPYDHNRLFIEEQRLGIGVGYADVVYDPPPVLLIFRGLAELPLTAAAWVWWALSAGALALSVWLLSRTLSLRRHFPTLLAGAALFGPALHSLRMGQIDLVLLLPFWVAVTAPRRDWAPGIAVLALLKPQLALVPVLYLVVQTRRIRAALGVLLTGSAIFLLGAAMPGVSWGGWLQQLISQPSALTTFDRIADGAVAMVGVVALVMAVKAVRREPILRHLSIAASANGLIGGLVRWNLYWLLVTALPALHELTRRARLRMRDRLVLVAAAALLLPAGLLSGEAWREIASGVGDVGMIGQLLVVSLAVAAVGLVEEIPARWVLATIAAHAVVVLAPIQEGRGGQVPTVLVGVLLLYAATRPARPHSQLGSRSPDLMSDELADEAPWS